jgi:hypothetical protein
MGIVGAGGGYCGEGEDGIEEKDSDKVEISVQTLPPSSELEVGFQPRNAGNQEEAKTSRDSYISPFGEGVDQSLASMSTVGSTAKGNEFSCCRRGHGKKNLRDL